jgi:Ca2+-binding RTX toxin-like protein
MAINRGGLGSALSVVLMVAAGCSPPDEGVVMGCFGLVNEAIPSTEGLPDVVTNVFFGGCSPDDGGMQIVERATEVASQDQALMVNRCDTDCNARLTAYESLRPEIGLPQTCQTFFAIPCDGIKADVNGAPGGVAFQAGGPADTRYTLTGTVTVTTGGASTPVAATAIVDATMACAPNQSCSFFISRLDVVSGALELSGMLIDSAHVQNQGAIAGSKTPTNMTIAANALEAQVSASVGGSTTSFHVRNPDPITNTNPNLTLDQYMGSLSFTLTDEPSDVTVTVNMTGIPSGRRPVASFTPLAATYECECKECTTVEFTSTATDPDNDLQSLSWKLNANPQLGDGTSAPQTLDLQLAVGTYTVALVATDTRGAAAAASHQFRVVDTVPPVVTPPPNVTMRSCDFPDIGKATVATDICSPDKIVISSNAPGTFPVGTTQVTWTAEDGAGNPGSATQTVTVTSVAQDRDCCPPGYTSIIFVQNGSATGTSGNDCIIGTSNNDVINGNGGDDYIIAGNGTDTINGGDGNDTILGGEGEDTINGGNGNDRIAGGNGQDTITGGAGVDTIYGGGGDDAISGNDGDDIIYGNGGQDRIIPGIGNDFVDGGEGVDTIFTGNPVQANGNVGDDTLIGGRDNDTISDTVGNNYIAGFHGDDRLTGGTGNDTILGGGGHNICVGGGGTDALSCIP